VQSRNGKHSNQDLRLSQFDTMWSVVPTLRRNIQSESSWYMKCDWNKDKRSLLVHQTVQFSKRTVTKVHRRIYNEYLFYSMFRGGGWHNL
jgi:hypothetical protein